MDLNRPVDETLVAIDTDMGYDDVMAIAMLLAANTPIAGITTVNGLAHARLGAKNALCLLERMGHRDIPVAIGADAPLVGNHAFETPWRNEADTMAGITLPPTDLEPLSMPAPDFLVDRIGKYPSQITLLCLGPLTNIALALQQGDKMFAQNVKRIVMMGGAVRVPGNDTPNQVSEWNLYVDPLAAARTIHSGIPLTMVGLDVTNQARCTNELVSTLCEQVPIEPAGCIIQESLYRMYDYLYDPVAAAYILDQSILQTKRLSILVVTEEPNSGQTIESPSGTPIDVALALDEQQFRRLLLSVICGTSNRGVAR